MGKVAMLIKILFNMEVYRSNRKVPCQETAEKEAG